MEGLSCEAASDGHLFRIMREGVGRLIGLISYEAVS